MDNDTFYTSSEKCSVCYKYIDTYLKAIEYDSFEDESLLYADVIKKFISSKFDVWGYGNSIDISSYDDYYTVTFTIVELTITDIIKIKVYNDYTHTDIEEFKLIYQELLRIDSLLNVYKTELLNYFKTLRLIDDNLVKIYNSVCNHFIITENLNKDDFDRQLKLKYIELL